MPGKFKAYFFGENKQIVNGRVVADQAIKSEYDGNRLHIDKLDNNKLSHAIIKDKELGKILTSPTSEIDLFKRLNQDFNKGKGKSKNKRKRTSKNKRTRRRTIIKRS